MSAPSTTIYFCSATGLNNRYEHSIHFQSDKVQKEFFLDRAVTYRSAYTYIRRSWSLRVDAKMSAARQWDYCFFHNADDNKWYYFFINRVEYVNDSTVTLDLELDVIQTYMFDWELLPCFVERNHTTKDDIGMYTEPEGLDTGELLDTWNTDITDLNELVVIIMATVDIKQSDLTQPDPFPAILGSRYHNIFGGAGIFACEMKDWEALSQYLLLLNKAGKIDSIIDMWMYPKALLSPSIEWGEVVIQRLNTTATKSITTSVNMPTAFYLYSSGAEGQYIPRNKKLLTYPYSFLYVTNNSGAAAVFRYENTKTHNIALRVTGAVTGDAPVRIHAENYRGEGGYEEGINLAGFPKCSWNSDAYKIWLAQNQTSQGLSVGLSALSIAGGVGALATGNVLAGAGMIAGGVTSIASTLAQNADRQIQPPQAHGNQSVGVNVVNNKQTFTLIRKQLSIEKARILDDFFTMYGYRINRVQTPILKARPSFTYVKTANCHVRGSFGNEDATKIESVFNNGVTFWTDGDNIGDYSQDNAAPTV